MLLYSSPFLHRRIFAPFRFIGIRVQHMGRGERDHGLNGPHGKGVLGIG